MSKQRIKHLIICFISFVVLTIIDQITKYLAVVNLKGKEPFSIIDGVLEFYYLENTGAAFGLLKDQKIFFIMTALIFTFIICFILIRVPLEKKYRLFNLALIMIMTGAIGNMTDRFRYSYVIDFIYFKIINFPIFNFADICVTLATILLIILLGFYYKEDDLEFLSFKQKKYRELK